MHVFRQVQPVVPRGSPASIVSPTIMCSETWEHFTQKTLTENMREEHIFMEESNTQQERKRCLNKLSERPLKLGKKIVSAISVNVIEVPKVQDTVRQLQESTYDYFYLNFIKMQCLLDQAMMSSTNGSVIEQNNKMLKNSRGCTRIVVQEQRGMFEFHVRCLGGPLLCPSLRLTPCLVVDILRRSTEVHHGPHSQTTNSTMIAYTR